MWLTEEEVAKLTRRTRPSAQARVLLQAKIPYRMVDGRPVVRRDYQEQGSRPMDPVRLRLA